jgi:quinoprotein glucose dehydrogenase
MRSVPSKGIDHLGLRFAAGKIFALLVRVGTASLLVLAGAWLLIGGAWLAALGGSPYYLLAGAALLASAWFYVRRSDKALWIFALTILVTIPWSLWEVGLRGFELQARLLAPIVFGLWLLLPFVRARLGKGRGFAALASATVAAIVVLAAGFIPPVGVRGAADMTPVADGADASMPQDDWRFYARTARGDRFSPLDQITPQNVGKLQLAWQIQTGDGPRDEKPEYNFEATPIKVGDTLYLCTAHSWVVALDAATGRKKWVFDPRANTNPNIFLACRGVSYYEAPKPADTPCPRRIIAPVADARLMAINADTGKPCEDFGKGGFIDLRRYLGPVSPGFHFVTSAPMVLQDRIVLGGWIADNQTVGEPSGAVRAFDPITGDLVWAWDVGHTPENWRPREGEILTRATPNAWGPITADPGLGLVYLPLGNATPDHFGPHRRPFDEKYSSSVVAVDIKTGAARWHFQTIHHDVWDLDVPSGPSLVDLPGPNGMIPALVQPTKRGELFLLDRRTGKPIADVVEKPVSRNGVPGETLAKTQPYSTGMPSLAPDDLTENRLWGATPFDQLYCRIQFKRYRYFGQFTPPAEQRSIMYPAADGIVDWHGVTIDPDRKILIANGSYAPFIMAMPQRAKLEEAGVLARWDGKGTQPKNESMYFPQYGTPYAVLTIPWLSIAKVPCNPPPWGNLTAIDLKTRKIVWQRPLGTTRDTGMMRTKVNLPLPTGVQNIGGNIVTRGGVIFVSATADRYLRAFDERTGKLLWQARLPAGGQATPMSYSVHGKQYVVIAAGGHQKFGTKTGDYVVAYALPGR